MFAIWSFSMAAFSGWTCCNRVSWLLLNALLDCCRSSWLLFTWFSIRLLKGRSSSHRELIAVFFIALFAFPLAGFGYRGFLNGALDDGPAAVHQVIVLNKYYSKSKNSYTYYAVVNSWRKTESTEKLRISKSFYNYLNPGSSTITVTTKPGRFGFEWIVDLE